jgi:predicted RNase H-like HicB family nuclease
LKKVKPALALMPPDLPGCVAVAETRDEVVRLIEEAIEFHVDGLRQDGQPIPEPSSSIEYVEIRAASAD